MGLLDLFLEKQRNKVVEKVAGQVTQHLDEQINKAKAPSPTFMTGLTGTSSGAKRYQFSQDMVNGGIQRRKKPGSDVSFETLRRFSISHEISRACINFRKRQITGMEWNIGTADPEDDGNYEQQEAEVKEFFKTIGGRGIGYRRFMDRFIEDLMVLDAVALEKQLTRNNKLHTIVPLDGATIRLRVDESGATPEPPEAAYVQVIRGQVTASWTDDEMIYAMMNSRNDTPYGLAPLESLMIIVTSSLKSGMYNLGYLTDGNIPEGIIQVPENWTPQMIKDFEEYWDGLMAGDETRTRRLKFMPGGTGAGYVATKKPDDMAFEQFNDWLMKITCALFEVNPIDLGFNPKSGLGGKGFVDGLQQGSYDKGLLPLALFIEEMFTKIIQEEFGYTQLKFNFPTLKEKDAKGQAEINQILINSGQRTIDELRTDDGLDPLPDGVGSKPFVSGQISFLDAPEPTEPAATEPTDTETPPEENVAEPPAAKAKGVIDFRKSQIDELRTFRKYAVNRFKAGKTIRPFVSKVLPLEMVEVLNEQITKAQDLAELRRCFSEPVNDLEMQNVDTALAERNRALNVV